MDFMRPDSMIFSWDELKIISLSQVEEYKEYD